MKLEEQIMEILGDGQPRKGRDIAKALAVRFGIDVDKSEINSLLYKKLNGQVRQNKAYEWSIAKGREGSKSEKTPSTNETILAKLARYYLECISKDMNNEVSVFARSKFSTDYTQLDKLPIAQNISSRISNYLLQKVKESKGALTLKIGYPVYIKKFTSKKGDEIVVAEPLFLFSIDLDIALQNGFIKLDEDDPVINSKAFLSITGIKQEGEMLTETVQLYEDLGLNNGPDEKPGMDDLFSRLHNLKPEWNWKEDLDVHNISSVPLGSISSNGIYNAAAVFPTEKSKYTVGLEKDLKEMMSLSEEEFKGTALGSWINNSVDKGAISEQVLIEPIALNEEQRTATGKGLSAQLTVITGPPGTGKSQVVTSLIVNAVYHGQTVLFASKNNKAVDVVNSRVNGLSDSQVMLRLGNKFQTTLATFLSGLLAASPSDDDEFRYKEAKEIHEQLLNEIASIRKNQRQLIDLRNSVDTAEGQLETLRTECGDDFFALCKNLTPKEFNNISAELQQGLTTLQAADRREQGFFTRLCWSLLKSKRIQTVLTQFENSKSAFSKLSVPFPATGVGESNIDVYKTFYASIETRLNCARQIRDYFAKLDELTKALDLFQLSVQEKAATDRIVANSENLWNHWLTLLPKRLSQNDRMLIGNYIAVLNLIISAENSNQVVDRAIWARYYSILPKLSHIFSCWAVTSLSARGRIPLTAGFFDLVIIDEASQCDIASAIPLLYRAKRAVIIGDDKQLTHISSINEKQDAQLLEKYELAEDFMSWSYAGNSLFALAASKCPGETVVELKDHHRSHSDIISYSNKHFYGNKLRVATNYKHLKLIGNEPAVRWVDVKGVCLKPESGGALNDSEAARIVEELERLVKNNYRGSIGVVTPFRAQSIRIQDRLSQKNDLTEQLNTRGFLCDTVHKFQGDERDVIIFSTVISQGASDGAVSFLERTGNLFNVAITRARSALIIVGDKATCYSSRVKHYRGFVDYLTSLNSPQSGVNETMQKDYGPDYPKQDSRTPVSDWEKRLYKALYKEGIATVPQHKVDQYSLDLALFHNGRMLNIEVDGEKYHRAWDGELLQRDQLRNKRMLELGWDVQRFWVYEVRDNLAQCVHKVKQWKEQQADSLAKPF